MYPSPFDQDTTYGEHAYVIEESMEGLPEVAVFRPDSEALAMSQRRIRELYSLAEHIGGTTDVGQLLRRVVEIGIECLQVDRMVIALKKRNTNLLEIRAIKRRNNLPQSKVSLSRNIVESVLQQGVGTVINDTTAHPAFRKIHREGIRAVIAYPIRYRDKIIGLFYADRLSSPHAWDEVDLEFMNALGQLLAVGLLNSQLHAEFAAKRQMESELKLAREVQQQLLPKQLPQFDRIAFDAINEPGRQVSGDYYDVLPLSNSRVGVVIADVSGKGASAAIIMANLQAAVRLNMRRNTDLATFCGELNRHLCSTNTPGRFVTAIVGIVDLDHHVFEHVNAGHFPPWLIVHGQYVHQLPDGNNLPLGAIPEEEFNVNRFDLPDAEASLFMITDGVCDGANAQNETFGTLRINQVLSELMHDRPDRVLSGLHRKHQEFCGDAPPGDDVTMLAVRVRPATMSIFH